MSPMVTRDKVVNQMGKYWQVSLDHRVGMSPNCQNHRGQGVLESTLDLLTNSFLVFSHQFPEEGFLDVLASER